MRGSGPESTFTLPARRRWELLPAAARQAITNAAWCVSCAKTRAMLVKGGSIVRGDLVLSGNCSRCGGEMGRLVEGE